MLCRVARATEAKLPYQRMLQARRPSTLHTPEDVISLSACESSLALDAKVIVAPTNTGRTPARVSRYRPRSVILALTPSEKIVKRLELYWGVYPVRTDPFATTDSMLSVAEVSVTREGLAKKGDTILIIGGTPGVTGTTDLLKIKVLGSSKK
jgi:pyruvate kinase